MRKSYAGWCPTPNLPTTNVIAAVACPACSCWVDLEEGTTLCPKCESMTLTAKEQVNGVDVIMRLAPLTASFKDGHQ